MELLREADFDVLETADIDLEEIYDEMEADPGHCCLTGACCFGIHG